MPEDPRPRINEIFNDEKTKAARRGELRITVMGNEPIEVADHLRLVAEADAEKLGQRIIPAQIYSNQWDLVRREVRRLVNLLPPGNKEPAK